MASTPPHNIYNNFYGQFNVTFVSVTPQPCYEPDNNNTLLIITQKQAIFAFAVSALLNILQLKYNGNDDSPFVTHPKIMGIATLSVLVYCLACDAELRICSSSSSSRLSPNYGNVIVHLVVRFLGYFSLVSLGSVIAFPKVYVLLILYLLLVTLLLFCLVLHWVKNIILVTRGYTYNSPSTRYGYGIPMGRALVNTNRLPV